MQPPNCSNCRVAMEEGFMIEHSHHSSIVVPTWTAGQPQKTWLGIRVKGEKVPVTTYRCPRCGLLQSYAQPNS